MLKYFLCGLLSLVLATATFAQERKTIKPKPEEEPTKPSIIKTNPLIEEEYSILRSKLERKPLINTGGVIVGAFDNQYIGFGGQYQRQSWQRLSWSLQFQYFSIPSDEFYFDYYTYQYIQRTRGSMFLLTLNTKVRLPIFQEETNILPFGTIGAGPALAVQSNWDYNFPNSVTHAYSVGGTTAFSGLGIDYLLGSWIIGFDVRYQLLRFPKVVMGKHNFDGFMVTLGAGKMF